jgi:cellulose biosynthesis protein BcsQ
MIVTVGNTKGGVGKTTLAIQLALARALAGRDVLVDGDRQGSAQMAITIRAACLDWPVSSTTTGGAARPGAAAGRQIRRRGD